MEPIVFLIPIIITYLTSQFLKSAIDRRWSAWDIFMRRGGPISAHSGVMMSLCACLWWTSGVSPLFISSLTFAFIIYSEIIDRRRTKESHTIYQLIAGGVLGLIIAFAFLMIAS